MNNLKSVELYVIYFFFKLFSVLFGAREIGKGGGIRSAVVFVDCWSYAPFTCDSKASEK